MTGKESQQHDQARNIIGLRWKWSFRKITKHFQMTRIELRELQKTEPYKLQVWAEYDRTCYLFTKHKTRELCVKHIRHYFGVSLDFASKVLGKDWSPPLEPPPEQLHFNLQK